MQETQIQSLGREDLLEKEMVTHSRTHAWKTPWPEEPGELPSWVAESDTTERNRMSTSTYPLLAKFYRREHETHKCNVIQGFSGSGRAKF